MLIHTLNGCSGFLIRFEVDRLREENNAIVRMLIHDSFPEGLKVEPDIAKTPPALQKEYVLVRNSRNSFREIIYAVTSPDIYSVLAKELLAASVNNEVSDICVERIVDEDTSLIFVKVVKHLVELYF